MELNKLLDSLQFLEGLLDPISVKFKQEFVRFGKSNSWPYLFLAFLILSTNSAYAQIKPSENNSIKTTARQTFSVELREFNKQLSLLEKTILKNKS